MIVCQTYIAQLSASMTSALENEPLNGVEDLPNQNKIRFGAIKGGSTLEFFKVSCNFTHRLLKCLNQMIHRLICLLLIASQDYLVNNNLNFSKFSKH